LLRSIVCKLEITKHVNNCPTRCNNIQFIYICKLLYMFRVVTSLIIRSSYHCVCSVWHYWDRTSTCLERNWVATGTVPAQSRSRQVQYGLNNAKYCKYSDMSSWWWMELTLETCRAVYKYKSTVYFCILLDNYWHIFHDEGTLEHKIHYKTVSRAEILPLCITDKFSKTKST
jgi:hypothetical protein